MGPPLMANTNFNVAPSVILKTNREQVENYNFERIWKSAISTCISKIMNPQANLLSNYDTERTKDLSVILFLIK